MRQTRSSLFLVCLACVAAASAPAQSRSWPDSTIRATIVAGDAAWSRGARDSAYLFYHAAVQRDSGASTRALFRLGVLEGNRNRLDDAAALLRAYVRREPGDDEGRIALARVLAWTGRYDESVACYDQVLARDSTYRDAALGRAQALTWASRLPEAMSSYRRWLAYAPADASAQKGVARIVAWRGDLAESERLWRALVARYPDDVATWVGLAQVQRWAGRAAPADSALRRALQLAPASSDAREELALVRADLDGAAEPAAIRVSDSDGNRSTWYGLTMTSQSLGSWRLRLSGTLRETSLQGAAGTSTGARASATWALPAGRLAATAELGAVHLSSRDAGATSAHTRPQALLRVSGALRPRTTVGVSLSKTPFDETTPLIARGIVATAADVDLSMEPWRGIALGGGAGHTRIDGGTVPNARRSAVGVVRWAIRPGWSLSATARGMRYDTTGRGDGYFSPNRFSLLEVGARKVTGRDRGWGVTLEAGVGRQAIRGLASDRTRSNGAARGSVGVRFRPLPGYEMEAAYGVSSVASPFTQQASEYRARSFSVRGRLKL